MTPLVLIDGDVLLYRVGFAVQRNHHILKVNGEAILESTDKKAINKIVKENDFKDYAIESTTEVEPIANAYHSMDTVMDFILRRTEAKSYEVVLSGTGNYRDKIATIAPYKGNRDKLLKPYYYHQLYDYLVNKYGATIVNDQEADDYLGITQTQEYPNSMIVTIDKDLDQIIGSHYNHVDDLFYDVTQDQADFYFYCQILAGDPTDNIKGIPGIAMKKATGLLESGFGDEKELLRLAQKAYADAGIPEQFLENARLVRIRRKENELWTPS